MTQWPLRSLSGQNGGFRHGHVTLNKQNINPWNFAGRNEGKFPWDYHKDNKNKA